MRERAGLAHDPGGENAAQGQVDEDGGERVCSRILSLRCKPPKSLDRNDFRAWVAAEAGLADKSVADGAATLTAITAASVAAIVPLLPAQPRPGSWRAAARRMLRSCACWRSGCAREHRNRERGRLEFGFGRSAGLRLYGGAPSARIADHVSDHDRRAEADAGRGAGEAVISAPGRAPRARCLSPRAPASRCRSCPACRSACGNADSETARCP